jgi:hypothetical protein
MDQFSFHSGLRDHREGPEQSGSQGRQFPDHFPDLGAIERREGDPP